MIYYEWIDFKTDTNYYSQQTFEEDVGDQFEAVLFEKEKVHPTIIWTKQYVILVKTTTRMYQDITFIKIARHPTQQLSDIHHFG
ncbi:hypothetical protein [Gracilibacillus massiliensis]|uniref:hypothetical protein n=1 Tax=Gracilibacillus massiliensis TaxID=1564956 RepID=UPI00071D8EB6|nr:hypothetical protein [Gracilibacillus massiliensis]